MKTTYLIWKDPNCNGVNPDWQEICGQEFLALVRSPENEGRHFIKLLAVSDDGSDGNIVMEATAEKYRKWRKEKRHRQYLRDVNPGYQEISYHAMADDDGGYGEEVLTDTESDLETDCFRLFEFEAVRLSVERLSDAERRMLEYLYLSEKQETERGYSELTGIPQKTVNDRKKRILVKLKKFLE